MKKSVAVLLTTVMIHSLAGCGSGSTVWTGNADNKQETSVNTETSEELSVPVTLEVTTTFAGEDTNATNYKKAVAAWEDETGNVVNDASGTSSEAFKARVIVDFESGAEPDVLFFYNGVESNPFVEAGRVVSVEEIRQIYPDYAENMKDGMLGASPADGKNYSIPLNGYWEGLFVNKQVCKEAGVEIPTAETTWDEFMDTCRTIRDAGLTPIAVSLSEVPHYWFEFCIYNYLMPATHSVLPKNAEDEHGKAWIAGINDIKQMYENGYFQENAIYATDGEAQQLFYDGKAAFMLDGSWRVGGIEENAENADDFTVTYMPGKNNRKTTDIIGGLSSGWFITRKAWEDPEKQEAAVAFVKYMTSDEMVSGFASVSATALKNGSMVDKSTLSTLEKEGLKLVAGATGMSSAVQDQITQEQRAPVFDNMPVIVSGKKDIKDAVEELIHLIETDLDEE